MRYQVDFLLPLKLQKISHYFGLCGKILLPNQFAGFFTFDLFDLLILILRYDCFIVLVSNERLVFKLFLHDSVFHFVDSSPNELFLFFRQFGIV